MKYITYTLLSLSLILGFTSDEVKAVDSFMDQSSYVDSSYPAYVINDHLPVRMYFTPSVDYTTGLSVYIKHVTPGSKIKLNFWQEARYQGWASAEVPSGFKWVYFSISPNQMRLKKEVRYNVTVETSDDIMSWSYAEPGGYDRGMAVVDGFGKVDTDFGLITYGYNEEALANEGGNGDDDAIEDPANADPAIEQEPNQQKIDDPSEENVQESETDSNDEGNNTQNSSSTNSSSTLQPPEKLEGKYSRRGSLSIISLSWMDKVSSNIEGYKIFRSENGGDYSELGSADKGQSKYFDSNVREGVDYTYYMVSYSGSDTSKQSDILEISTKTNASDFNKNATSTLNSDNLDKIYISIIMIILILLVLLAGLYIAYRLKTNRSREQSK